MILMLVLSVVKLLKTDMEKYGITYRIVCCTLCSSETLLSQVKAVG